MNYHGIQNTIFNKRLVYDGYPRCAEKEDWHHVIQCKVLSRQRKEFMINLHTKLQEENVDRTYESEIL